MGMQEKEKSKEKRFPRSEFWTELRENNFLKKDIFSSNILIELLFEMQFQQDLSSLSIISLTSRKKGHFYHHFH